MEIQYAPGRMADVHGSGPTVLMWHGRAPNERRALATLAEEVALRGRRVVVPDWDSTVADGGRAELLTSVRFARESADHDPDQLVLVGWSLGGTAALSLTQHQRRLGIGLAHTVVVAAGIVTDDPISGGMLAPPPRRPDAVSTRIDLVCGTRDDLMVVQAVHDAHDLWAAAGWDVHLTELDADHFTIVTETAHELAAIIAR